MESMYNIDIMTPTMRMKQKPLTTTTTEDKEVVTKQSGDQNRKAIKYYAKGRKENLVGILQNIY